MSDNNIAKPLKCPHCNKKLDSIVASYVAAEYRLDFNPIIGKYVPYSTAYDVDDFVCPHCNKEIPDEYYREFIDKNIVCVQPSGGHKPFRINLLDLPINTKYIEFFEKLPKKIGKKSKLKSKQKPKLKPKRNKKKASRKKAKRAKKKET